MLEILHILLKIEKKRIVIVGWNFQPWNILRVSQNIRLALHSYRTSKTMHKSGIFVQSEFLGFRSCFVLYMESFCSWQPRDSKQQQDGQMLFKFSSRWQPVFFSCRVIMRSNSFAQWPKNVYWCKRKKKKDIIKIWLLKKPLLCGRCNYLIFKVGFPCRAAGGLDSSFYVTQVCHIYVAPFFVSYSL